MASDIKDVLVLKTPMALTQKTMMELYDNMLGQLNNGLIIIPHWLTCEVVHVPKDVEVRIESKGFAVGTQLGKE